MSKTRITLTKPLLNGDVLVVEHETESGEKQAAVNFTKVCAELGINDVSRSVNETEKADRDAKSPTEDESTESVEAEVIAETIETETPADKKKDKKK
jgi:hypothetical protein